ncbi:MAG: hypothetical protein LBQ81_08360 [Zoogloeaceae bacterium]|jgi:hypothetical protein|nr:hypothetical protein [Zoogloeaceae bacterium]
MVVQISGYKPKLQQYAYLFSLSLHYWYALCDRIKPIGVADYELAYTLLVQLASSRSSIERLESELSVIREAFDAAPAAKKDNPL